MAYNQKIAYRHNSYITRKIPYTRMPIRISVGNKGKWQLYKVSCLNIKHIAVIVRQVAITCRRSTSVVRNLKFLTPFFVFLTIINIILSTNRSYVISPCDTNSNTI